MFRSLFPFRRLLATTFLVVFVNVFVGQCYCATLTPPSAMSLARATSAALAKPAHPGCAGHSKVASPAKARAAASHQSTSKHDCCKDKSASLLSSLTTPVDKQVFTPASALLPEAAEFCFRSAAGRWDRTNAVVLVLREHLPPKIPDIRIFIQSLTV
ncbi:hypothetical protein GCM10022408_17370 [Hymenobacter fastidiosus]|uniref:Uncharacterized protein n=1 Tax=Hymenobacter fastidiosus TaxID=486264 RepID=A0ABP7S3Q8_9BACT